MKIAISVIFICSPPELLVLLTEHIYTKYTHPLTIQLAEMIPPEKKTGQISDNLQGLIDYIS